MKITHYHRKSLSPPNSIRRVFASIRPFFFEDIEIRVAICPFRSKGLLRRLVNIMWAFFEQSDVNHVTGDVHFLTLGLSKRKTILTVHDCVSLHRLTGLKQALFRFFWYTLPVRKANVITVISEFTKQELLQYVDCAPEAVRVIPDPVSTDFYYVRKPFNDITPRILQIGTKTNKNLTRVVQAVEGITCHLRIIGHLSNQQKLVLERANITYSAIADIPDEQVVKEYRDSDLVVFASTYEGFGLPIVEAQATGRPVITSNIPPMTEVAGDAACLIDPRSVNSIRAGIQKVIKDVAYRESLVRKGIENVKRFSPEQIAKQYADLYREVYRGE